MPEPPLGASQDFENALRQQNRAGYLLRLYVTGTTPNSVEAIKNIKQICEDHLKDRYELQVIDIYQKPDMAKEDQIMAIPALIKALPAGL